jgi:hypothetical protein
MRRCASVPYWQARHSLLRAFRVAIFKGISQQLKKLNMDSSNNKPRLTLLSMRDVSTMGMADVLVPCGGHFRYLYQADCSDRNSGERWEQEVHYVYDFALSTATIGADAVALQFTLETSGIGPLEKRLLRATLLLSNRVALHDIVDVQHGWPVRHNHGCSGLVVDTLRLVFSSTCYLPLRPAGDQFTVRLTCNTELGGHFCFYATPLYYTAPANAPLLVANSRHVLEFVSPRSLVPTPLTLSIDASGRLWNMYVEGLSPLSTWWRPFFKGFSTRQPIVHPPSHPTQQHSHHSKPQPHSKTQTRGPQKPFDQTKKEQVMGEYASFGWQPSSAGSGGVSVAGGAGLTLTQAQASSLAALRSVLQQGQGQGQIQGQSNGVDEYDPSSPAL